MDEKRIMEQQLKLLQTVVEQQQSYIQAQNVLVAEKDARMAEKDDTIAELRRLAWEKLQSGSASQSSGEKSDFGRWGFSLFRVTCPSYASQIKRQEKSVLFFTAHSKNVGMEMGIIFCGGLGVMGIYNLPPHIWISGANQTIRMLFIAYERLALFFRNWTKHLDKMSLRRSCFVNSFMILTYI